MLTPTQFEICFACGDDGYTLARSLGLNPDVAMQGVGHAAGRGNMHPSSEDQERLALLRVHAEFLVSI